MIIFSQDFFAALSSRNDRILLLRQDLMVRAEILAGSGGMVVNHLQAGILTWEEAENEMREIGSVIGVLQGIAVPEP